MKFAHNIITSVFAKEGEDEQAIQQTLLNLHPFPAEKFLHRQTTTGANEQKIIILKTKIEKESQTNAFLQNLKVQLSQKDREILKSQKETRLDDEFSFFIRLNKPALLSNQYKITDAGNCYHVKNHLLNRPCHNSNNFLMNQTKMKHDVRIYFI